MLFELIEKDCVLVRSKIKNINKRVLMLVLVIAITFVSIPKSLALGEDTIVLYHTNDIHGKINSEYGSNGKLMQIGMDVLKTVKSQTENALLVDAGDATQGTVLAKYSKGSDMIRMMNNANYDVMALGNHDLDYGADTAKENANLAEFPVICANAVSKEDNQPFLKGINGSNGSNFIKEINGKKIGFFSVISEDTASTSFEKDIAGLKFTSVLETSKVQVAELKQQGAQAIVALTHVGVVNGSGVTSEAIAEQVDGIDIIIDGHSHTEFTKTVNNVLIQQIGTDAKNLGKIELEFNSAGKAKVHGEIMTASQVGEKYKADPEGTQFFNDIYAAHKPTLEKVISKTENSLYGGTYLGKSIGRLQETNMGDLVADMMREETKELIKGKPEANEDIVVLQNGGGVRDSIKAGYITVNDINRVLPNDNTVVAKEVTPSTLYKAIENGVCKVGSPANKGEALQFQDGRFPQISGMRFEYDITKKPSDPNNKEIIGERVNKIVILNEDGTDKKELDRNDDNTKIVLVTSIFTGEGGEGYWMLKDKKVVATSDEILETIVEKQLDKMAKEKGKGVSGYYVTSNRISLVKGDDLYGSYDSNITLKDSDSKLSSRDVKVSVDYQDSVEMKTNENGIIELKGLESGAHSVKVEYDGMSSEAYINECVGLKDTELSFNDMTEHEADSVVNLISQIPDKVSKDDASFISFVRKSYDSLSEDSKVKVTNYVSLTSAEKDADKAQNDANSQIAYNIIYVVFGSTAVILLVVILVKVLKKSKSSK